jgi:MFS family permease
MREAYVAFKRA